MIEYLSLEEILRIHFQLVEDYGGSHGIRDESRVDSVVNAPKQIVFGVEQYPNIVSKAAVYLHNIISDHPFVDGNKRTAITVAGIFLMRNGYSLKTNSGVMEEFVVSIASDHLGIDEISDWIKSSV